MGQMNYGVAGGVAVAGQASGVTLALAGDYAAMTISQAAPPAGPDSTARVTVSATGPGALVTVQKLFPGADPTNPANWTTLGGVLRLDTNLYVTGSFTVPGGASVDLNLGGIAGLGAVRVYLNIPPTAGSVLAAGSSTPGTVTGNEAAMVAQLAALVAINQQQALALSELTGTDYTS